jgi:predicted phage terminase large subunit-like protein
MLNPIPDEGQEVTEEDIQYYDKLPVETELGVSGIAIDLAISKKQTADKTAGVPGKTAEIDGHFKIYITPDIIHGNYDLHELKQILKVRNSANPLELTWIEQVAYQKAAIDEFQRELLPVEGIPAIGDKRARLKIAAQYIKNGTVLFPRHGAEELIIQLLNFGNEEHDDLVDALVYLILELIKQGARTFQAVGV